MWTFNIILILQCYMILSYTWTDLFGNNTLDIETFHDDAIGSLRKHGMVLSPDDTSLYVFGGLGYDAIQFGIAFWCFLIVGRLNDLWRFDLETKLWYHVFGNLSCDVYASYGDIAYPGGVEGFGMIIGSQDKLYIFGGEGFDGSDRGLLNDLWTFDINTAQWVFLSGNQHVNSVANYTVPYPGGLKDATMVLSDDEQALYIYGGYGFDETDKDLLWCFNITTTTWSILSGSGIINTAANYTLPYPGGIFGHSMLLSKLSNALLIYGGKAMDSTTYSSLNGFWRFSLNTQTWEHLYGSMTVNETLIYNTNPGSLSYIPMIQSSTGEDVYIMGGQGWDETQSGLLNDVWRFSLVDYHWSHLYGHQMIDIDTNFTEPYLGGIASHTMVISQNGSFAYVFGGDGYINGGIMNNVMRFDFMQVIGDSSVEGSTVGYESLSDIMTEESVSSIESTSIGISSDRVISSIDTVDIFTSDSGVVSSDNMQQASESDIQISSDDSESDTMTSDNVLSTQVPSIEYTSIDISSDGVISSIDAVGISTSDANIISSDNNQQSSISDIQTSSADSESDYITSDNAHASISSNIDNIATTITNDITQSIAASISYTTQASSHEEIASSISNPNTTNDAVGSNEAEEYTGFIIIVSIIGSFMGIFAIAISCMAIIGNDCSTSM